MDTSGSLELVSATGPSPSLLATLAEIVRSRVAVDLKRRDDTVVGRLRYVSRGRFVVGDITFQPADVAEPIDRAGLVTTIRVNRWRKLSRVID